MSSSKDKYERTTSYPVGEEHVVILGPIVSFFPKENSLDQSA